MIWNNPHQQPSKESMKTSVKIQETHLSRKRNGSVQKFLQDESLMKMKAMRRRRIKKEGEISEVYLFSSFPIGLYKEKRKVKIIFLTLGRNYQIIPLVLPTIHTSPKAF